MTVSFWKHHPISDQHGQQLAQEAIDFQNKFQFDFLKLTPAGDWLAVCYGAKEEVWKNDAVGRAKNYRVCPKRSQGLLPITSIYLSRTVACRNH